MPQKVHEIIKRVCPYSLPVGFHQHIGSFLHEWQYSLHHGLQQCWQSCNAKTAQVSSCTAIREMKTHTPVSFVTWCTASTAAMTMSIRNVPRSPSSIHGETIKLRRATAAPSLDVQSPDLKLTSSFRNTILTFSSNES